MTDITKTEIERLLPKADEPLESKVEAYLTEQAALHGGVCRKVQAVGRVGFPDRLLAFKTPIPPGWSTHYGGTRSAVFLIETKRPTGKTKAHQELEHAKLRKAGLDVRVLYTKAQVDEFFTELCELRQIRRRPAP